MNQPIIQVNSLTKSYRLGSVGAGSMREEIAKQWSRITGGKQVDQVEHFNALDGVTFDVHEGEILGVIGRNGAGKSTLLKVLSRITEPTSGMATLHGRVASLLEVGTGFHPELSGRDNIYLSGAVLGMTREEIKRKFDAIVSFAGIEKFIDLPIKRYSSGMAIRLGFAVAAHLDSDILIIDEVLAVGDINFQEKCMSKMNEIRDSGRTILFVSHNPISIEMLCHRCILLEQGKLVYEGAPRDALEAYREHSLRQGKSAGHVTTQLVNTKIKVSIQQQDADTESPLINLPIKIVMQFELPADSPDIYPNCKLFTKNGNMAFSAISPHPCAVDKNASSNQAFVAECEAPANFLNAEEYYVSTSLLTFNGVSIERVERIAEFKAIEDVQLRPIQFNGIWTGAVRPSLPWTISRENPTENNSSNA